MLALPTHRIVIFGFLAFIVIGLEQGMLGLFVADLGERLVRTPEDLGLFFALHGVGSAIVTGSALISWLENRNSKRIALASLALGLGSLLVVVGDTWSLKLLAAPLLGAGFGGLSMSFNTLFVTYFSQKNAGLLNVLNATYGVGAVASPWLLSQNLVAGSELFLIVALLAFVVMIGAWNIDDRIPSGTRIDSPKQSISLALPLLATAFLILFIEAGLTYWLPSLLTNNTGDESVGATFMTRFFFWFVFVRLGAAALAGWVSTLGFATVGLVGIFGSLILTAGGFIALPETSFMGAFMGLIFPNAYAWMLVTGNGGTAMGAKILLSAIAGATLGPWVLGWILPNFGESAVLMLLGAIGLLTVSIMVLTDLRVKKLGTNHEQIGA